MTEMTTRQRFQRMFAHKEADRIPISDGPWGTTIERWEREGMPAGMDYRDYFGLDKVATIFADNSPQYEVRTLEENDRYKIITTGWGATLKQWKHATSTPEFMDFTIKDAEAWKKAKARMTPEGVRVDWNALKNNWPKWKAEGQWIQAYFWFGFDVAHSWAVGTETLLIALMEEPEWCVDMFNHYLDVDIAIFEQVLAAGYTFDSMHWPDDMGYKNNQFFSLKMYRELLKPVHKRAVEWAHSKGMVAHLHSCGDINPLVPDLLEIGIDAINPLEVKAGMNPVALKRKYGDRVVLHGGINAVLWDQPEAIQAEMRAVIPVMKENGGYIFASDHSIPDSVSLEDFRGIIGLVKELGRY